MGFFSFSGARERGILLTETEKEQRRSVLKGGQSVPDERSLSLFPPLSFLLSYTHKRTLFHLSPFFCSIGKTVIIAFTIFFYDISFLRVETYRIVYKEPPPMDSILPSCRFSFDDRFHVRVGVCNLT